MWNKLGVYARLMRLDKPIGILLLLWPTLWALWLASDGKPAPTILLIFVIGTVLMRSAGCVINDYADRRIDPHVERTRTRPLASGEIGSKEALLLATALALMAFLLILPLNHLVIGLSLPALLLAASYPYTKRFFAIPQAYLGIAFGFGIPMAYAAVQAAVPAEAWVLLAANICWAIAYDTEYAMVDRDDDRHLNIHSSALLFGRFDVAAVMLCQILMLVLVTLVGLYSLRGNIFLLGMAVAAALALYQYRLIRQRERRRCFAAFLHNNWVGATIFAGIFFDYLLLD